MPNVRIVVEVDFVAEDHDEAAAKRAQIAREIAEYVFEREDVLLVEADVT